MVANPEICRLNGAKSKGPKTKRGKAIASRNSVKHGLLVQQPPLLVTEDLSSFEGMMQGLIDYYQPDGPIEYFLIQQIAMGMVRQHRLWSVEVAIANIEILQIQKQQQFPDRMICDALESSDHGSDRGSDRGGLDHSDEIRIPWKELCLEEQTRLSQLVDNLADDLEQVGKMDEAELLNNIQESMVLADCRDYKDNDNDVFWQLYEELDVWLDEYREEGTGEWLLESKGFDIGQEFVQHGTKLLKEAKRCLKKLEEAIAQLDVCESKIQQAEEQAKGVQQPELFNRYQREISRELYEAIDRLHDIQEKRLTSISR